MLHLHIGGQTIRTTTKHPFYVCNQGWTPVNELEIGQWILSEAGEWKAVEEIYATGEWEIVYNLRIEEYHTYFVGDEGWGWSLWAHNACKELYVSQDDANPSKYTLYYKDNGIKVRVPAGKSLLEGTTVSESSFADAVKYAQAHKADLNINPSRIMTADPSSLGGSYSKFVGNPDVMGHKDKAEAITDFKARFPTEESFLELTPKTGSKSYPTVDEMNTFIHAHHIVMKKSSGDGETAARKSRQILRTVGIEPFLGVQNLVFAPNWANHSKKPDYPQAVLEGLLSLGITPNPNPTEASIATLGGKKAEVEAKLKDIAEKFFVAEYSM